MPATHLFPLAPAINHNPLIVAPDTPLTTVIDHMSHASDSEYHLPEEESSTTEPLESTTGEGCALVMVDTQLVGIFTERDVVTIIAAGRQLSNLTVAEVMTQPVITLTASEAFDVLTALRLMRHHGIHNLPVVNEQNQLLGLVTSNSVRQTLNPTDLLKVRQVGEVMTTEVIHAAPVASVLQIAQMMVQYRVSCVVIAEERENLGAEEQAHRQYLAPCGIITAWDMVQYQRLELDLSQSQAQAIMSAPLFLIHQEAPLWAAHQQMQHHHVSRLVVVGPQGELQGIVTQSGLLQVLDPGEMHQVVALLQDKVHELETENIQLLQKRTAELEQNNQYQAALLDFSRDAIIVLSQDHQISFWNKGAEHLYGWTATEVLGQKANDLLYSEGFDQLEEIQNVLSEQEEWQGELQQVTKSGQQVIVMSRWALMRSESGQPDSMLVVNTNITERKDLEKQFLRAQRLESVGTLAGGIAHDLNNILTPIMGVAHLLPLKMPQPDPQCQHLIEMLQNSVQRGADLVKQVLSFSRGVEGQHTTLQVGHLISEIKDFIERTFPKTIEFHMNFPNDLRMIQGDATQLHQVLMNLCVNARDAMPQGGTLSFAAENVVIDASVAQRYLEAHVGPYVMISVSDTGVGIPPETLDLIFDPFFTTKDPGQGTGLGLSTLMGIVKSHGGFVTVDSQMGVGTKFSVFMPAEVDPEMAEGEGQQLNLPAGRDELILVVDDEAQIREITQSTLEAHNYRVITANNGIQAIAQYVQRQDDIAAILMNIIMPEMDGKTAIQTLRAINPQVKIIADSGLVSGEQIDADIKVEVDAFLPKPYTTETVLVTLQRVLNTTQ